MAEAADGYFLDLCTPNMVCAVYLNCRRSVSNDQDELVEHV